MKEIIEKIVNKVPKGYMFDSHFVINQMIKNHLDEYLLYASNIKNSSGKSISVHGNIGKRISEYAKSENTIKQLEAKSWSENIRGNASECTAWLKL